MADPNGESKLQNDLLVDLAKSLENVPRRNLTRALRALKYADRTDRINMYLTHATTMFGSLVAGTLVYFFLSLAREMVRSDESGYGVILCGLPTSAIAGIFVLKKLPDFKALASLARQIRADQQAAGQSGGPSGTPPDSGTGPGTGPAQ